MAAIKLSLTPGVVGLVGSSSSNPTVSIAEIAGASFANLILVGFWAGSPTLSDQAKYPTFIRVNPTASDEVRSIASLMQRTFGALPFKI